MYNYIMHLKKINRFIEIMHCIAFLVMGSMYLLISDKGTVL